MAPDRKKLTPTNDFVLLKEDPPVAYHEYKQYTKIVVPDKFEHGPEDRMVSGVVLGKGDQCRNPVIQVGQRILIGKWDGARFPVDGETMILVKEDSILAVVE